MNSLNVIILAADGPSFGEKDLPACLQILKGGTTLLDYQIRTLNLCGIDLQNIFIVVGKDIKFPKPYKSNLIIKNKFDQSYKKNIKKIISLIKR